MNPTIAEAFRRAIAKGRNLSPSGMPLTLERIVVIYKNGQVQVSCQGYGPAVIPVTGEGFRTLRAGGKVAVAWEEGRPIVAIAHSAKRSGAPTPLPRPTAPLVEDLFLATRPDGIVDVYFRNFDDVTPLRLDRFIAQSELSTLKWGPRNDRFFVQRLSRFHIFKLDREPDEAFAAGADPGDGLTLERTEDLSTNTTPVADLHAANQSPSTVVLTPAAPASPGVPSPMSLNFSAAVLDTAGNLIVTYTLILQVPVRASVDPVSPYHPLAAIYYAPTSANFSLGRLEYPVVVDVTNGVVLLSALEQPDLFGPAGWPALVDYNGTFDWTAGLVIPVAWSTSNEFICTQANRDVHPFPQVGTPVTWLNAAGTAPDHWFCQLDPILVLGPATKGPRVRGWVAWMRQEYPFFVAQAPHPDFANLPGYIGPQSPSQQLVVTVTVPQPAAGASAQAPLTGAVVTLYPLASPALGLSGLSFAPTLHRVLWRKPFGVAFQPADTGLNAGGADSPGFVTLFDGGATVQISPTLRASVGQRGLNVLLTDFLYQLDNPAVALPAQAEVNFFVDGWDFGGATTLNTTAADFPAELDDLEEAKPLADLPEGVSHPTSLGLFSLYVNNSAEVLEGLGLFEELPA